MIAHVEEQLTNTVICFYQLLLLLSIMSAEKRVSFGQSVRSYNDRYSSAFRPVSLSSSSFSYSDRSNAFFARSENCGDRVLHCLSQVPCASLIAWIILLTGLGGLTGSLLIGVQKTRDFLDMDDLFWFLEYTLIGVVVGMFVIGTILLCVGHISTDPTSRHLFHTTKKNYCAQGLNIFMLVFSYLLGICWIVVTAILGVPVYLLLNYILIRDDVTSFNLVHYGLGNITVQGENDLDNYRNEAKQEIISYSAAFISSLLIAISMIHFMLVLSANIKHLRESRFATLHAYDVDDTANSKTPMVADTTM